MYGPTRVRSGWYDGFGGASIFLTRLVKALALPSRPGLRKSNNDHRSESRFSTGVPVMAMRPAARSSLAARA